MSKAGMACESVLCNEPTTAVGSPGAVVVALIGTAPVVGNGGYTWE